MVERFRDDHRAAVSTVQAAEDAVDLAVEAVLAVALFLVEASSICVTSHRYFCDPCDVIKRRSSAPYLD